MANTCCSGSRVASGRKAASSCCGGVSSSPSSSCCAAADTSNATPETQPVAPCADQDWIIGSVASEIGDVPRIATTLSFGDIVGSWKCRWSIGRMDYKVEPGLYAVGSPDTASPVLVTSNYKMTFDRVRAELGGLNLWLMVLDTDGVNVWCAAGKGTFGTDEVVRRLEATGLSRVVSHRTLILPQLGAVGVAAHEVRARSGFRVVYGPIRAKDIPLYLQNGQRVTDDMRKVQFTVGNRAVLTPIELVGAAQPLFIGFGVFFVLNAVGLGHFGWIDFYGIMGSVLVGAVAAPILLPWIPGRAFSFKGGLLGLVWAIVFLLLNGVPAHPVLGWLKSAAHLLLLPALSGFLTMNFTGSSTYTSLSGVDREMKIAVPIMLFSTAAAVLLLLASDLFLLVKGVIL